VRPDAVLKVGGSLCERPHSLGRLMAVLAELARIRALVVVPGGGRFAEEVRRADRLLGLGASPAHWMAILAMDQTAHLLAAVAAGAVVVERPREVRAGRLNILAPSRWLREANPLPHSWTVTSDSIAAWVAGALGARRLVLLKSVEGAPGAGRAVRARATPAQLGGIVDEHFARALRPGLSCWIVGGARPERVAALLATGTTYGTEVSARGRPARRRVRATAERARRRGRR